MLVEMVLCVAVSVLLMWLSGALLTLIWGLVVALAGSLSVSNKGLWVMTLMMMCCHAVVGGHAAMRTKTLKSGFNQLREDAKDAFI